MGTELGCQPYASFVPHRAVERAPCPELCAGRLEKLLMHMWRWWSAKSYKVSSHSILLLNPRLINNNIAVFLRQESRNRQTDAAGYF